MTEDLKNAKFMDQSLDIDDRVADLLERMTFKEKCVLCAGEKQNSPAAIPRLGIKQFMMTDGPHGVSPGAVREGPNYAESTGVASSTGFPPSIQMASTFNKDLLYKFGVAIAEETRAVGRRMILGPAFNITRSPMNGRTFEYYSEDPYVSGVLAIEAIKGIQSVKISCCAKHYVANSYEANRFKVNEIISRRTLEEIYLKAFKMVVQESDPWSIMSSYNKINGTYVSEHKEILRTFLKDDWGFSGTVVSDWGATNNTSGIKALVEAGLDIEMGSRTIYQIDQMEALKEAGDFPEKYFEDNTRRILKMYFRTGMFDDPTTVPEGSLNTKEHQKVARDLANEGMILFKNDGNLLPLNTKDKPIKKIAILGKHADIKFGRGKLGGGSSAVQPPYEITVREGVTNKCKSLGIEVVEEAADADVAIVCVGLEHHHGFSGGDHEGSDKLRYGLGYLLPKLINKTVKANKNTVVVFLNGSPFGMRKFEKNVPAILEAWYGGMEVGNAVADILFGDVNPSGKMPISWPKVKKDIPTALTFWETIIPQKEFDYEKEGIFIGYRYYDTYNKPLQYCFGHGLSYTKYKYDNLKLSSKKLSGDATLKVSLEVSNVGDMDGKETIFLFISDLEASVERPKKELKKFYKASLDSGESKSVEFAINKSDLSFFSEEKVDWVAENGKFKVLIGSSVDNIHVEAEFDYSN